MDKITWFLIVISVIIGAFTLYVMAQVDTDIVVGKNAATRQQVYQTCLDEFDTSSAKDYQEYESLVMQYVRHEKECRKIYLES